MRARRGVFGGLAILLVVGISVLAYERTGYYRLPARERLEHPQHALLRSSGKVGLLCGLAGTALFLVNLSYLLRKHLLALKWLGTLRAWMGLHLVSGIFGAALIVFHSSFLLRSALGVLALSGLGIVILTGTVGRYLYALVPRADDGRELEAGELRARVLSMRRELDAAGVPESFSGSRAEMRRLRAHVRGRPEARILPIARAFSKDRWRLARLSKLRAFLGSWRFLHRWLAIVMIVLAAFHIVIAVRFGDLGRPW